jgi:hypothetical protein
MIDDTLLEAEEKMDKAVSVAKDEFANIRTGRAHPSMFSKITAEYYGTQTPVNQLASFHMPEAPGLHQGRAAQGRGRPGLDQEHPQARQGRHRQAGQEWRRRRGRRPASRGRAR